MRLTTTPEQIKKPYVRALRFNANNLFFNDTRKGKARLLLNRNRILYELGFLSIKSGKSKTGVNNK